LHYINTRGQAYKLYPHNSGIDVRKSFFSERVIAPWNNLPATSEHFSSLSSFKYLIHSTDFSMYVSLGFYILIILYSLASQRHISIFYDLWRPVT